MFPVVSETRGATYDEWCIDSRECSYDGAVCKKMDGCDSGYCRCLTGYSFDNVNLRCGKSKSILLYASTRWSSCEMYIIARVGHDNVTKRDSGAGVCT